MEKILVFIYNDMADFEFTYTTHLLGHELSKQIVTCAYDKEPVKSKGGVVYLPTVTVSEVNPEDYVGLIITGGWNPVVKDEFLAIINELYSNNKLVAAICAGPRYLAKAGILKEVKYTTSIVVWDQARKAAFKEEEDPFPRENFIDARVVRDRNVITSKGISFVDFSIEVADYFGLFKEEADKQKLINLITGR